ncbi:aldehyde oxidase 1-like isoform X3 [Oncorhynchus keta]|uniref:aldehyde oxidase 1-like isoform X3 n=1 Tax=Oncorhynchus keta TaxID=8018 RepID=UPI0015F9D0BC|nr:aldehyde oxidase 1-like isoform X3 [Oncorhynchus keta]
MSAKWHILLYSLTVPDPVGRPIMHRSAFCQATGEAVYRDDIPKTDKELHLVLVTSTRPHSNILTGRAVRCVRERGEEILITGARQPVLGKHQVGFMNDGRIMAADLQYYANSGNTADESLLIREINMYKEVSLTHYKFEFDPKNLLRCWDECREKSDYCNRRKSIAQFNQQNRWKKRGMATIPIKYGIAFSDGFLNQVASTELHIPASLIHITETNTSAVPNTCPSAASFGKDANGMACKGCL